MTPVRIDLHVHSTHSPDGRSSVAELAAGLSAKGLAGFALTDHNSTSGHAALRRLGSEQPGRLVLPGVEVSTRDGHLLVYGVDQPAPPGRPLAETVEWAIAHGGEAVVAHPFRRPHGAGRHLAPDVRLRAVEAVNGHSSATVNARGAELARARSLPTTGGSDAHVARELGRAVTIFPDGTRTVDDLLEALRQGKVVGEGSSLGRLEWLRWGAQAALDRLRRGLRSV